MKILISLILPFLLISNIGFSQCDSIKSFTLQQLPKCKDVIKNFGFCGLCNATENGVTYTTIRTYHDSSKIYKSTVYFDSTLTQKYSEFTFDTNDKWPYKRWNANGRLVLKKRRAKDMNFYITKKRIWWILWQREKRTAFDPF